MDNQLGKYWWIMLIHGSVLFAALRYAMGPGRGIIALVWLLGVHALILVLVRIVGSFRLRTINKRLSPA
jgi:uncharacterized membrane protein HdeD (DUF308 family)